MTDKIIIKEIKRSKYLFYHHKDEDGYKITRLQLIDAKSSNELQCEYVDKNRYDLKKGPKVIILLNN